MVRVLLKGLLSTVVAFSMLVGVAGASDGSPAWSVHSLSRPTNLVPGTSFGGAPEYDGNQSDYYEVVLTNIGGEQSNGDPVTVTDTLPEGLTLQSDGAKINLSSGEAATVYPAGTCSGAGRTVTCTTYEDDPIGVGKTLLMTVPLVVAAEAPLSVTNTVAVSGGGAASVSATEATTISTTPASFGLQHSEITATGEDGASDTQAGSHPFALTTSFDFNTKLNPAGDLTTSGDLRNVEVALPPGLVGDVNAVPQCAQSLFQSGAELACPDSTQVGTATLFLAPLKGLQPLIGEAAIYNLTPRPGVPAELGFDDSKYIVLLTPKVRSGGDYGLTVSSINSSQVLRVFGVTATIWGTPDAASHDEVRGNCYGDEAGVRCPVSEPPRPFLTMPTSCGGALSYGLRLDSWQDSEAYITENFPSRNAQGEEVGLSGCNQLPFEPSPKLAPETVDADTPTGLTAEVNVPQEGLTSAEGVRSADLKNTTVTLPQGVAINPGQAAGLAACQPSEDAFGSEAAPSCPSASRVGTDEIVSPLLRDPLVGNVYVLQSNPPNLELLVAASADGVNVKLVGKVHLNEATGQLVTTFTETPQLPFTNFKLIFSGGAQAALTTPTTCGVYGNEADFTPWSSPLESEVLSASVFAISAPAAGASSCTAPLPFSPSMTAGATTDQAGGFTNFSLLLARGDDQQRVSTLSFKTPAGLSGMISKVPLCAEAQANAGTCPASSQIGHTVVEAGPGPYPLVVPQPGQPPAAIYLTEGYKGAPYGLSIVVPLVVGPFVLQTQVVRASIAVDPYTAQLTITTDPLPQVIDGIPTDLRTINAVIERPEFMFNPTDCNTQSFSGTATSAEGATAPLSSHFQVGSCQSLKFQPKFTVSTPGHTSKTNGAGLTATVSYPKTVQGTEANIKAVKVDLPKQLPSQLKTLQRSCPAKTFEEGYEKCLKAYPHSKVGEAIVHTPLLPVPLQGPAVFVSHGGEAFPSLTIVLRGYGVTIDLVGSTFIHNGITSTTFKSVPDVPFSTFELTLFQGEYAALTTDLPEKDHGNLCGQKLAMPTAFLAQNGAEIHESTKIAISGCTKTKKTKRAKKKAKGKKAAGKK